MNREEKAAAVEQLTEELKGADAIFAIDYRGISVPQAAELRTGLREAGASFRVVKNRLTLRAADAAGTAEIKDFLTGPTALTLVDGDVALAAKTISKLGGEWELLAYKGGIMGDDVLDPDQFKAIAKLPGRDQLNAQFAGVVASPLTGLVRGLGSMISGLASQLQQMADQGLVSGDAPAEESLPDPEPSESPEEEPSEEQAPEGEEAGLDPGDAGTGEGDQDLGEEPGEDAEQTEPPSEESDGDETSDEASGEQSDGNEADEQSDETKEDGE